MSRISTTRDDAPAYLARYEARRAEGKLLEPGSEGEEPGFVARARERATRRALAQLDQPSAPPGRTEAFASETVAPRELMYPESIRRLVGTAIDVRLIRHGQTQGYIANAALTPLGRWQSHRKGQDLAKGMTEGAIAKVVHAPTPRAQETAEGLYEGLLQGMARFGISGATVHEPRPVAAFDNFQVYWNGKEVDLTSAFIEFANTLEAYERDGGGYRPGWMVEMDRVFRIQFGGGDPITYWLGQPMQYFEPPVHVVRRYWNGILTELQQCEPGTRLFVCAHSGPIRAVAASAAGHDPGEPNNTEDVRIKVHEDRAHATVTYRGRGIEIDIPTLAQPSWW